MKKAFCAIVLCTISFSYAAEKPSLGVTRGKSLGDTGADVSGAPRKQSPAIRRLSSGESQFFKDENLRRSGRGLSSGSRERDAELKPIPERGK
jgi:hypothetical protein